MALIDVLKYNGPSNVLAWKWQPNNGGLRSEELRLGSQLVVGPAQEAIFVKGGQILDLFGSGTHTLSTQNLPLIADIVGLAFGGQSPFKAEVYFINKALILDSKFGLLPFNLIEPNFRVPIPVTSRGSFGVKILDSKLFLKELVGSVSDFSREKLTQVFRGLISEQVKSSIANFVELNKMNPLALETAVAEISKDVMPSISFSLKSYGLHVELFNIEAISVVDDDQRVKKIAEDYHRLMSLDMEERMRLTRRAENIEIFRVEKAYETSEKAAASLGNSDGGIAGSVLGLGVALPMANSIGTVISETLIQGNSSVTPKPEDGQSQTLNLIKELSEMHKHGILTDEEFSTKKAELLKNL